VAWNHFLEFICRQKTFVSFKRHFKTCSTVIFAAYNACDIVLHCILKLCSWRYSLLLLSSRIISWCVCANIQAVLTDISTDQSSYARDSDLFAFKPLPDDNGVVPHNIGENIVVEFRFIVVIIFHVLYDVMAFSRCRHITDNHYQLNVITTKQETLAESGLELLWEHEHDEHRSMSL